MHHFDSKAWDEFHGRLTEEASRERWNKRAATYAKGPAHSSYVERFIEMAHVDPTWTVLDVGSGPGTLAIPLAKLTSHVTALDLSPAMLSELEGNARAAKVENITAIEGSWSGDWGALGVPRADLVIASRSFAAPNLQEILAKLDSRAAKRVCLTTISGAMPRHDHKLMCAIGRPIPKVPDYIEVVDCLYDMGIRATVDFIDGEAHDHWRDTEEAKANISDILGDLSSEEGTLLDGYLAGHLVPDDAAGEGVTLDYDRAWSWAFIAWDKKAGPR